MHPSLIDLATKYQAAKQQYDGMAARNTPTDPAEMVRQDIERRKAMREMNAAQDAYNAALDAFTSVMVA